MYCSISCSRAARSPSSWYLRRRSLSLSATSVPTSRGHLLREADRIAVHVHVVNRRLEHTAQTQHVVLLQLDLVEHVRRQRADARLQRTVADRHANCDVPGLELTAAENGVEGDLQVLEVLDREVHADCESAEHEMRDAMDTGVARTRP